MNNDKYEQEAIQHEHRTVRLPLATYNRIALLVNNLQKENKGIKSFFYRWSISQEPLRETARSLYDELLEMEASKKLIEETRTYEIGISRPIRAGND